MKARKLCGARARACIAISLLLLIPTASALAFTAVHTFDLPGGGKMTVTTVGPKGGEPDHLTWKQTDKDGKTIADGKAKKDGNGTKSEWKTYDGNGKKSGEGKATTSPTEDKSEKKDTATGDKTTHVVKKDGNGNKTQEDTTVTKKNGESTSSSTTYQNGKPHITTTTTKTSDQYATTETQIWDPETGKQSGGTLQKGGETFDFDPNNGTYKDPGKTKPSSTGPPSYSRLVKMSEPGHSAVALEYFNLPPINMTSLGEQPVGLPIFDVPKALTDRTGLAIALRYINSNLAGGTAVASSGGSSFFNTGSLSHELKYGAGFRESLSGTPIQQSDLDELFPTGFDFGASVDIIFGVDPNFLTETHHHVVHGHTWKTEKEAVGKKLEDADQIPGGPDILVDVFKNKHVKVNTSKTVTTHTKKDISVVEDGDVGGNLNVTYWCNRYVGIEAFNTILSAPGGTVDILGARVEARLPMICGGENHPFGFAPFVYAGCSGTMGGYEDLFGFDIGGGFQLRTRCGFKMSVEAGADLNGTQNYGIGAVNFMWHKPLE